MNATAIGLVMGLKTKKASATPPAGYVGMTHQQYMPQYQRRTEFTPEEQELIRRNKGNVIPKIFTSQADSPAVDMASPAWSALGGGALGAALGAGLGSYVSTVGSGNIGNGIIPGDPRAVALGAGVGGVIGAIGSALKRKARNMTIEEGMRRLPPGAVRRDIEADPVYQAERDRNARLRAATIAANARLRAATIAAGGSKFASAAPGMDPLRATATGAGVGAALGGAMSFGDPGMMGRGALAGGSTGYLVSAVDRIVAKRQQRQQRQRMEKPAGFMVPGAVGYGLGSALGGISNISESDPAIARKRRRRFALAGGLIGAVGGALQRQRMEKPAAAVSGRGLNFNINGDALRGRGLNFNINGDALRRAISRRRIMSGVGAVAGNVAARGYVAGTPGWVGRLAGE